jgi:hypothetical protein
VVAASTFGFEFKKEGRAAVRASSDIFCVSHFLLLHVQPQQNEMELQEKAAGSAQPEQDLNADREAFVNIGRLNDY